MFQIRQCGDPERSRDVLWPPPDPGERQHQQDQADRAPGARHLQVGGVNNNSDGMDGINKQFVRALGGKIVLRLDNLSWISRSRASGYPNIIS